MSDGGCGMWDVGCKKLQPEIKINITKNKELPKN